MAMIDVHIARSAMTSASDLTLIGSTSRFRIIRSHFITPKQGFRRGLGDSFTTEPVSGPARGQTMNRAMAVHLVEDKASGLGTQGIESAYILG